MTYLYNTLKISNLISFSYFFVSLIFLPLILITKISKKTAHVQTISKKMIFY